MLSHSELNPQARSRELRVEFRRAGETELSDETHQFVNYCGAGTGKTNTLAHKTAQLILHGVAPERILLMTFARTAGIKFTSEPHNRANVA